jgi:putative SOS response-associated peptidase YedK
MCSANSTASNSLGRKSSISTGSRCQMRNRRGLKPSYNVAPTHVMPIVRPAGNGRELVMAG